ncbi:MAG: ferritin-like domain-containing protein [Blastocatellia bacterium]|nr:ferritin-like domain-containing protein [Blastocatellia bacterium]MCS7158446.1 ferritin-like domain-containing protein [Blastocatellia bacterium]MCX7753482.1 ferritin-like domain-containing protein [Blastocatellia bacterium]MDW8167873.1 ferritin-like domain-containing protein [Acidobacteriota bacterium]MDW8255907.1 ferritin-like domain-containing protein [Acidobacteriota bacterium]
MDREKILNALNKALAQEYACFIRYKTHAAVITGPYAKPISEQLDEIAEDEESHARDLRDRITGLGGTPTMAVTTEDLIPATTLEEILRVNIEEEKKAIALYQEILNIIPREQHLLYETIQDILEDEFEHLEELQRLQS